MAEFIDDIMGYDPSNLEVFNEKPSVNYDENIYKTRPADSKAEDGHYRSRLRIIYNPFNFKRSIVPQATYAMSDVDGFFMVKSKLAEGDKNCPLFKAWKKLWFSGDDTKKAWAKEMYDKTESQWVLVQILEDDNQPELVGQIKAMKLPKAIYVKMSAKMNPSAESKKAPVPVMDYLIGLPLDMDVTPGPDDPKNPSRKQREISYDLCEFDTDYAPIIKTDGTPLFADSEMELIDTYNTALTDLNKAKTAKKQDDAKAKLAEVHDAVKELYKKALEYLKENAINLDDECAFKEWDADTTARVQRWIDTVAQMKDPKVEVITEGADVTTPVETTTETSTSATSVAESMMAGASEDNDEGLPF